MAAHSFHVLFCVVFKIFTLFYKNFVYPKYPRVLYFCISTSISKILAAGLERTNIGVYFRDFTLSAPPGPIMNLILFDFRAPSGNSFNRKRRHIYYPINGYPDSKLSVLSIPNLELL